ncbi:MAG: CDP-alcohol phosphatidyltransferase family protein [Lysobacteraceae bacterium]|nr:MAG: CDP-alcohol phosphatidyltransferase family protein [Xanthomonadaceae bacterium]
MSIYALKPRFQALLRPLVRQLYGWGVSANTVTVTACAISIALGLWLYLAPTARAFLLLPAWLFLRMAFNAIDGMLAREFGQRSHLGAYLNEMTDVIADAALVLPFAAVAPFSDAPIWIAVFAVLAGLSEFAGALGPTIGASRRYDGPMGKSDRAFALGALALWFGLAGTLPAWAFWIVPLLCAAIAWTIARRVRNGLREAPHDASPLN